MILKLIDTKNDITKFYQLTSNCKLVINKNNLQCKIFAPSAYLNEYTLFLFKVTNECSIECAIQSGIANNRQIELEGEFLEFVN